ncbi:Hypothetical protein R9X50_00684200 [Acrodontium crateriforme]|uniref:Uncharacterized protein n=1 Tax=Acrodontium crateriforme TaxID=150365 RepID=A0AAQ3RAA5_9PEZI|nr:Hypothetical protein R9X50_00684200 [Acrodontium crateriforme]
MFFTRLLLGLLVSGAIAQDDAYDYGQNICFPQSYGNTDDVVFYAPCDAVFAIMQECTSGSPRKQDIGECQGDSEPECLYTFDNATQRACICGSQFFDQLSGCKSCFFSHGLGPLVWEGSWPEDPNAISSSYCAVKSEPTLGFYDVFAQYAEGGDQSASPTFATDGNAQEPTWSDPIGNKTDPALYFTPAVTGANGYHVALHTVMPSSDWSLGSSIRISYSTSNGYFVPTATPDNKAAASSSSTSGRRNGTSASAASLDGSTTGSAQTSSSSYSAKESITMSGMAVQQTAAIAGVLAIGALAIAL